MANEHGNIVSKAGNIQHPQTCFDKVIDENNNEQTLTEWRAEVTAALASAAGSGGTTYTQGTGISISAENVISVNETWLDAKGYATTTAVEALQTSLTEASAKLITSADYDAVTGKLSLLAGETEIASATIQSGSSSLKSVAIEDYDPDNPENEGKYLVFEWELADQSTTKTAVNLSDIVDLSDYATTAELTALEESLPDKYCVATVTSNTGTSIIQNETTGGGPKYQHVDGTYSYVGVHNGGADDIGVQTYVKNNETSVGTRINVYVKGAYYIPNKANTDADYVADDPDREIAVKGDLTALEERLAAVEALLEKAAYIDDSASGSQGNGD